MPFSRSLLAAVLLALTGCTGGAEEPAGHTHGAGSAIVSLPVGDGTQATEVGYSLEAVALPQRAGATGEVRFRIDDFRGTPVTDYLVEQTRELHLYVVREDLAVFRHLHPRLAEDGTWSAPVALPAGGDYRVITEFVAEDEGGNGDHVILGETVPVPGASAEGDPVDPMLRVDVTRSPRAGPDGRMTLVVRDRRGRPVRLDTYLGTYGHVTGFHRQSGAMVHLHPLGAPNVTEDGSLLTFHTEITEPGEYLLFVQVRIDGYLHRVPVEVEVARAQPA